MAGKGTTGLTLNHVVTITSADENRHQLDLNDTYIKGYSSGYGSGNIIFKNLDLFSRSNKGVIYAGCYITFDNVNFKGKTLISEYSLVGADERLFFYGDNTLEAVKKYSFLGKEYEVEPTTDQDSKNWFIYSLKKHINNIRTGIGLIVDEKSHVVLKCTDGMGAIYNVGAFSFNDIKGTLEINLSKNVAGKTESALYGVLSIEKTGHVIINSDGEISEALVSGVGIDESGSSNSSTIMGELDVNAQNIGAYEGAICSLNTSAIGDNDTIKLKADGKGKICGFDSLVASNPAEISIDLTKNTSDDSRAIEYGNINASQGKTGWEDNAHVLPFKNMNIRFSKDPYINTINVYSNEDQEPILKNPNRYRKEVYVSSTAVNIDQDNLDKAKNQLTGTISSTEGKQDIYVTVKIDGADASGTPIKEQHYDIVGTAETANVDNITYQATTDSNGQFIINLSETDISRLHNNSVITITAVTKNGATSVPKTITITMSDLRDIAKTEIEKAKQVADDAIKNMPGLTEENKKNYQAKVDQEAAEAEKKLEDNAVQSETDINNIKNSAITHIQQDKAKAEVRAEADKVEKTFEGYSDAAPDKEKSKAIEKVEEDETKAEEEIGKKTTPEEIKKAVDSGKLAIDKDGANAAIDHEAKTVEDSLGQGSVDKSQIEQEKDKAHTAINGASDQAGVNSAQTNGTFNIDVQGEIAKIRKAAQDADNKIDQDKTLTEEGKITERTTAKARVDQERDQTIAKINKELEEALKDPTTIAETLKHIKAEANDIINTINREPAKAEVEHAARVEKEKIANNSQLTEPEKTEAEGKVDTDLTEAEQAIDKETDNTKIESAKTAGINKIGLEDAKATAKEHVKQEATKEKAVVDGLQPLTKEEQEAYDQNIEKAKNEALSQIDNATDEKGITDAENNGKTSIDRESAKAVIDNEAEQVTKTVESLTNVDEKTKQAAEAKIKEDQAKFKKQIEDSNVTPDQARVNSTRDAGKKQIDEDGNVVSNADKAIQQAKDVAQKELEEAKNKAEADVKDQKIMPNLSDQEKQDIINKIEDDYKKAKDAVSNSKSTDAVNQARDTGKATISQDENKAKAHDAIDKEVKRAEAGINNLPEDEKKAAEDKITKDAKKAHTDVNNASDQNRINNAQNDGVNTIARDGAIAQINHEANKVTSDINGLKNVDTKAQQDAKNQVEKDKQEAIDKINNPNATVDSIEKDTKDGITKIDNDGNVAKTADDATSKAKQDANNSIDDQAKQAKEDIDSKHLTPEEKKQAKDQIDQDAKKAKEEINNAKGDDAVKKAQENGKTSINNDVNKADAKSAINDEADKVKKTIDSLPNLTPDEKKKYDDQVDSDAQDAKDNIDQATDQNTVTDAKNKGIAKIDEDGKKAKDIDDLDKAKNDAKKEIDDQANKTKTDIDNNKNLSDQEKKDFKDQVDQTAKNAKDEIAQATDTDGVNKAKENGLNNIKQKGDDAKAADTKKANASKNNQDNSGKKDTTDTNGGKNDDSNSSHDNGGSTTINGDQAGDDHNSHDNNSGHNSFDVTSMNNDHSKNSANDHSISGSTNAKSNGAKAKNAVSMTNRYSSSLGAEDNGEAKAAVIGDKESDSRNKLPQAGAKKDDTLGVIGLAIVVAGSLLGLGISKKRREK